MADVNLTHAHQKRTISTVNAVADVLVVAVAIHSVTSQLNPAEIRSTMVIPIIEHHTVKIKHQNLPRNCTNDLKLMFYAVKWLRIRQ